MLNTVVAKIGIRAGTITLVRPKTRDCGRGVEGGLPGLTKSIPSTTAMPLQRPALRYGDSVRLEGRPVIPQIIVANPGY